VATVEQLVDLRLADARQAADFAELNEEFWRH
jgi:hypothetical protein